MVRNMYKADGSDKSDESYKSNMSDPYSIKTSPPEVAANTLICLINQASFLLNRQIQKLEDSFLNEGGFTERMYKARMKNRNGKQSR